MTISYTGSLRFPIIPTGDPAATNAWGTIYNNFQTCVEGAITGNAAISIAGLTTYSLTVANDATDQARLAFYNFTGALTANCTVTMPAVAKTGWAQNNTTGGFDVILTTGSGATLTLSPGNSVFYITFGTDVLAPPFANSVPGAGRLVGEIVAFGGIVNPPLWLPCGAQAVSRTTYLALFAALSLPTTGTTSIGTNQLTNVPQTPSGGGEGMPIEGSGIPVGTIVTAITGSGPFTLTLSNNATGTFANTAIRFFATGQGDGSTTFNVPDGRGRSIIGYDALGGAAAGRLTTASTPFPDTVGTATGNELVQAHVHGVTDPGHIHSSGLTIPIEVVTGQVGSGVVAGSASGNLTTTSATTGISIQSFGGGASQNIPPGLISKFLIYAGV